MLHEEEEELTPKRFANILSTGNPDASLPTSAPDCVSVFETRVLNNELSPPRARGTEYTVLLMDAELAAALNIPRRESENPRFSIVDHIRADHGIYTRLMTMTAELPVSDTSTSAMKNAVSNAKRYTQTNGITPVTARRLSPEQQQVQHAS